MAPMARSVVARWRRIMSRQIASRLSGSLPTTTGLRNWISDQASSCAPRIEAPRKLWPVTPSSVSMASSASWLAPVMTGFAGLYCSVGRSSQRNIVSVRSVTFMSWVSSGGAGS